MAREPEPIVERRRALGAQLATFREAAELTQGRLAQAAHCDRTTVNHIEKGRSRGDERFWEATDKAVQANGALLAGFYEVEAAKQGCDQQQQAAHLADVRAKADAWRSGRRAEGIVDTFTLASDTASGSTFDEADRLAYVADNPRQVDRVVLKSLAVVLHESRRLEDAIGAVPLLPAVRAQLVLFERLVVEARGPFRRRVVLLGSQYAQFAAWLHSSADQPHRAHAYYDRATEWGLEADDPNMVATVLSMKGHLACRLNQLGPMLGLSEAAGQHKRASPGVRSLAVQQAARAHALLGDGDACNHGLDMATVLADRAAARLDREPPWIYFFSPDYLVMQRGRAYRYLGRYQQAEELLAAGLAALPPEIRHAEWALTYERDLEAVRERV
ncbi:MAG: helix-turn-helix domain-containing protein [Pseudonocardiaceae bacterium]